MIGKYEIIDTEQNVDDLIVQLEKCFRENKSILLTNYMNDIWSQIAIQYQINRYKALIKSIKVYEKDETKIMRITLRKKMDVVGEKSYRKIIGEYDKNYYLRDCGGYSNFNNSNGLFLDKRLQSVFNLVNVSTTKEDILDVGCGRGELAYAMAQADKNVMAIDYSRDAIELAKNNFQPLSNLTFKCADVFQLNNKTKYDKIVLADIVEHIEQPMLEKMLIKLSLCLSEKGIIVIHTAPNKEYYEVYWPKKVKQASELGIYLPDNPRSYYEEIMHINEQTPDKLHKTLDNIFKEVVVWTGEMRDMYISKSDEQQILENSIFAICGNSKEAIDLYMEELKKKPNNKECAVGISSPISLIELRTEKEKTIPLVIENLGNYSLDSDAYYNCNVSYHIIDSETNAMVEYDGIRTRLPHVLKCGQKMEMDMNIKIPKGLETDKKYKLIFGIVIEGCFWIDEMHNYCDIEFKN